MKTLIFKKVKKKKKNKNKNVKPTGNHKVLHLKLQGKDIG